MEEKLEFLNNMVSFYGPTEWWDEQLNQVYSDYGVDTVHQSIHKKRHRYLWKTLNKRRMKEEEGSLFYSMLQK